jgi:hypothetical protein
MAALTGFAAPEIGASVAAFFISGSPRSERSERCRTRPPTYATSIAALCFEGSQKIKDLSVTFGTVVVKASGVIIVADQCPLFASYRRAIRRAGAIRPARANLIPCRYGPRDSCSHF